MTGHPYRNFSTRTTPQSEPVPGKPLAKNNAGGFAFQLDKWARLERFLILGTEGGTFYVSERKLTADQATSALDCIAEDGKRVVDLVVDISSHGRAVKNDPALFVLAMAAAAKDVEVRRYALAALPRVARIGTHLFHFAAFVEQFRGWGRALVSAVAKWYTSKQVDDLAYQAIKYQQRDGWSHRDLLRLSHPIASDERQNAVFHWLTQGVAEEPLPRLLEGYLKVHESPSKPDPSLVQAYQLTHEMLPSEWLRSPDVWRALLQNMPMGAMVRNLARMSAIGLLKPMSEAAALVVGRLQSEERLKGARLHPLQLLTALATYQKGAGMRGHLTWTPVQQVADALEEAFYKAFGNVEPAGKRTLVALDVSSSMTWGSVAGSPLTPRDAAAAMAMVHARTEPMFHALAFSHELVPFNMSGRMALEDVIQRMDRMPMGATNCALPMLWALENRVEVDTFIIYTDSETWYGRIHPFQALVQYRERMGIPARLVVVGMVANDFTLADPSDGGMLDVVGFDTATPVAINKFSKGL